MLGLSSPALGFIRGILTVVVATVTIFFLVFFLLREGLVEMDVPTRQSYVMAVVPPSARTYASGMTNVTRNAGWAVGAGVGASAGGRDRNDPLFQPGTR